MIAEETVIIPVLLPKWVLSEFSESIPELKTIPETELPAILGSLLGPELQPDIEYEGFGNRWEDLYRKDYNSHILAMFKGLREIDLK